jgi:predicted amidophosphoribosyltransferase
MEIKKCARCGAFFSSISNVCSSCQNKESYDRTVLKNYFDENLSFDSVHAVSEETGISPTTIENYLLENNFNNPNNDNNSFYNQIPY